MADFLGGKESALTKLPLAQRHSPNWEVEPFRWLAVRYMQEAFMRIDEAQEAGKAKPWQSRIAETLGRH